MEVLTREEFLHTEFDGAGLGYGSGCGLGNNSGYGLGFGSGSGYSDSSGYSSGNSRRDGAGSGLGNGCGYGFGDGYGYGSYSDNSSGLKSFNGNLVDMIDDVPTILTSIIGNFAKGFIVHPDFSLTPTFVCKQGNKFAHGETLHKAQEALLEKLFNHMTTEERIEEFCKEFEPRVKRPATDFFLWHHRLTGSCEQGRKEFARQHDVDIDNDEMTPEEFFKLTRDSYGSEIIRQTEYRFASVSKD